MTYRANWCPGLEDRRIRTQYLLIINSVINLFKTHGFLRTEKPALRASESGFRKTKKKLVGSTGQISIALCQAREVGI